MCVWQVSAASNGRARVDLVDCLLLQHMLWRVPEQRAAVREWLWARLVPGEGETGETGPSQFRFVLNGLKVEAAAAVRKTMGDVTGAAGAREADVAVVAALRVEVGRVCELVRARADALARHAVLLQRCTEHLWLDPDEALAAKQQLLPRAEAEADRVACALADAHALALALEGGDVAGSPPDEYRLAVIEALWVDDGEGESPFGAEELGLSMKEAKAKYDTDTFRRWKRARKKAA